MFSEEELFENTPFYAKIAKMTRKGYIFMMSYLKLVVIWIKLKIMKQLHMFICTKEANNWNKLVMFIFWAKLGSYYRYVVPFTGEESVCRGEGHTF